MITRDSWLKVHTFEVVLKNGTAIVVHANRATWGEECVFFYKNAKEPKNDFLLAQFVKSAIAGVVVSEVIP